MEFSSRQLGIGLGTALLAVGMTAGCSEAQPNQTHTQPTPEYTDVAPDVDTMKTVGGQVIGIYNKRKLSEEYPAYSMPKGGEQTGSYGRGEEVDIVCGAATRYLLHNPDEWLDKSAVKTKAMVPKCTADQLPDEEPAEPTRRPDSEPSEHAHPAPQHTMTCGTSYGFNPATRKFDLYYHCS